MFLEYYGFREQPFGFTPDPRYLFPSESCREAHASLLCAIQNNVGFSALIADPGMGKTTLLFSVLERFRQSGRTAFVFTTQGKPRDLLRYINREFELPDCRNDPVKFHEQFKEFLIAEAQQERPVILLLDEAQNLDNACLETVRILSDFENPGRKLLHIVLAGQPQLADRLSQNTLSQLSQRVAVVSSLKRLTPAETAAYIEHHIRTAGYQGSALFPDDCSRWIAEKSEGTPRKINRLCFNALSIACALQKRAVETADLQEAGQDLAFKRELDPAELLSPWKAERTSSLVSHPRRRATDFSGDQIGQLAQNHPAAGNPPAAAQLFDARTLGTDAQRTGRPVASFTLVHRPVYQDASEMTYRRLSAATRPKVTPGLATRSLKVVVAILIVIEMTVAVLLVERPAPATLQIIDRVREEMQAILSSPKTSQLRVLCPGIGAPSSANLGGNA